MYKTTRGPCAFCPETADITGEHLWSAWAGKMFGERRYTFVHKEDDGSVRTWQKNELNSKANVVCSKCNSGWMSELESATKLVAGGMVAECVLTELYDKDISTIAAFGFLKAVVADHMHQNRPPFYTFEERQAFRHTLSIPAGVQMWLASIPKKHGLFKSMTVEAPLNTPQRFALNVFTYGLGHLVIQTVGCQWKKKALRKYHPPPVITQDGVWDSCSIPFWPNCRLPIGWPPSEHMGDPVVDEFIKRWVRVNRGW